MMSILMKAISHTQNSLDWNTWPFWFEISYEFLLNMIIFNILENLGSDKSGLNNLNFRIYLNFI